MRVAVVVALSLCSLAAATDYRFDMGPADGLVAVGYTPVSPAVMLADHPAFGWARPTRGAVNRCDPANPWFSDDGATLAYALYSDGVLSLEENTFSFAVEPGRYAVTAVIGDVALDEPRPDQGIEANGRPVVAGLATSATVKAVTFAVDAAGGRIALRFTATSGQRYVTVDAVTATPLAAGAELPTSVADYPAQPPGPEVYRRNWARYVDAYRADWREAQAELRDEGVDLAAWAARAAAAGEVGRPPVFFWGLGSWDRLERRAPGLDLAALCRVLAELGADGYVVNSLSTARALHAAGLAHAVGAPGETLPGGEQGVPPNELRDGEGRPVHVPGVWSNCAPEAVARLQRYVKELPALDGARFLVIDEPRGMYYAGRLGDYSPASVAAFRAWCAERGEPDLARDGIPPRGRTMAFHRWYQFRLESVPRFVAGFTRGAPAGVRVMPGNGDVGPGQMNHNGYWPPAVARAGMVSACRSYDDPAAAKLCSETLAIAHEHGGETCIVPPLYAEAHTPERDLATATAAISAVHDYVSPWHFTGPLNGPNRVAWMKTAALEALLAHALGGRKHTPPLYVWCPESLVYNDLVGFDTREADHWRLVGRTLADARVDYGVTQTLRLPPGAVVLYTCVRPVLTGEEYGRLREFVQQGGRLLLSFDGAPEDPSGQPHRDWQALAAGARRVGLDRAGLAAALPAAERNLDTSNPAVLSYLYRWPRPRSSDRPARPRLHLLNHTGLTGPATVILPGAMTDELTGRSLPAGHRLVLGPGRFALLSED